MIDMIDINSMTPMEAISFARIEKEKNSIVIQVIKTERQRRSILPVSFF